MDRSMRRGIVYVSPEGVVEEKWRNGSPGCDGSPAKYAGQRSIRSFSKDETGFSVSRAFLKSSGAGSAGSSSSTLSQGRKK